MILELLEFHRGFGFALRFQVSLPPHVGWVQPSKEAKVSEPSLAKFVSMGDLQRFDCLGVIAMSECEEGGKRWKVTELDRRILGEALFQMLGERLRSIRRRR